jgi:RNA polymerase sigma-70 factor, ECF subfamily
MVFDKIYLAYWQKVFRICMGYVNDHEWAKDIAQETFIVVFQQLPTFRNEANIGTWIYRITANHCLRQIEKRSRIPKADMPLDIPDEVTPNLEEKVLFLYQCIAELPETERLIISLELENVKQAEIAVIVGISEANVRVKIHRIKDKLTQKFSRYEH